MEDKKISPKRSLFQPDLPHPFPEDSLRPSDNRPGSERPVPGLQGADDDDYRGLVFQEPSRRVFQAGRPPDTERRLDRHQVKHRRSRRGCFTCRARKVKCDETRPVCVRCRKACKECKFPEESGSLSKDRHATSHARAHSQGERVPIGHESLRSMRHSRSIDSLRAPEVTTRPPPSIPDDELSPSSSSTAPPKSLSSEEFSVSSSSTAPPRHVLSRALISQRTSPELQFYLDFYRKHLSYHHFMWNHDCCDFISSYLPDEALEFEPLLYALIALSSYVYTVSRKPNGSLQDFIPFYSKSLSLLRRHLGNGDGNTLQFLMAILMLATFEEYLGDLISVTAHSEAARSIITATYTPEEMTESIYTAKILEWYLHFDLYSALLSGNETIHQRWFMALHGYWDHLKREHSENFDYMIEERFSAIRVLAADLGNLTTRHRHSPPDSPAFKADAVALSRRVTAWYKDLDPPGFNIKHILEDPKAPPPMTPKSDRIWPYCVVLMKFWSCEMMMKLQLAKIPHHADEMTPDVGLLAGKICKMYEAIVLHDPVPGAAHGIYTTLGPVGIVLAKSPEGNLWYRRHLASIESMGRVFSGPYRERLTAVLQCDPDWWLPNDELRTPIIKAVRQFMVDRMADSKTPKDRHKDLASLAGFFDKLNMNASKE